MLDVLEVDEAGDDADDAVVNVELPSPTPLELPLGGEAADAAIDDLEEPPGGEVNPEAVPFDVPDATNGVGLFLDVPVVKSCGEATLVDDVESAYLQLDVEGADDALGTCRSGVVGSW